MKGELWGLRNLLLLTERAEGVRKNVLQFVDLTTSAHTVAVASPARCSSLARLCSMMAALSASAHGVPVHNALLACRSAQSGGRMILLLR